MSLLHRSFIVLIVLIILACGWSPGSAGNQAAGLQASVDGAMAGRQGFAIVMDVESGRILAQHRMDTAARRLVPPGSVIKPFVLMALIEEKIIRDTTVQMCARKLNINGRELDCSHVDLHEAMNPVSALAYSCNSYFAHFATRLDPSHLVRLLNSFGLNAVRQPQDAGRLQLLALGEAGVAVTPLEIAAAYRRLAKMHRENDAPAQALGAVFSGLAAAAEYGTARLARPSTITIAGKTGTASGENGTRPHAWFAGYAPADRPEAVVVVFLETGSGGGDAAPIARKVFAAYAEGKKQQ